jgi:hypothetical protein
LVSLSNLFDIGRQSNTDFLKHRDSPFGNGSLWPVVCSVAQYHPLYLLC